MRGEAADGRGPFADAIAGWGTALGPELLRKTTDLFENVTPRLDVDGVTRDHVYGPHPRHRLDLFSPAGASGAPVLLFVHGGGFVRGGKGGPGQPLYDNVGAWCVRNGIVAATMNYRLAPEYGWPSGGQDVRRAVEWLARDVSGFGGDPNRIVALGHSAGATHVADMVVGCRADPLPEGRPAAAIMVSGIYAPDRLGNGALGDAYYGACSDRSRAATLEGLAAATLPCAFAVAEHDDPDFIAQAKLLESALAAGPASSRAVRVLPGHNHFSPVIALGTGFDALGPFAVDFIQRHVA